MSDDETMASESTPADRGLVLLDEPEDGICESKGWVSIDVAEADARDLLHGLQVMFDEEGREGRPVGPAKRVWLRVEELSPHPDEERWLPCEQATPGAREFWEFDATEVEVPRGY